MDYSKEQDKLGIQAGEASRIIWDINQRASEIPYHQEPWWELMQYWISELLWRRRFWNMRR